MQTKKKKTTKVSRAEWNNETIISYFLKAKAVRQKSYKFFSTHSIRCAFALKNDRIGLCMIEKPQFLLN